MEINKTLEKEVSIKILPATLIITNFVKGEDKCDYEQYLFEMIQHSLYFKNKSNNKPYRRPDTQAKGECDCISENYELDFKLLVTSTLLQALRELSLQIQNVGKTMTIAGSPRRIDDNMQFVQLHVALRLYNLIQLETILKNSYKYGTIECDIKTYLETLLVKKNLFLFFPFMFSTEDNYDFDLILEHVIKKLNIDFKESIKFRNKYCKDYDTYFSFIYDSKLIILEFKKNNYMKQIENMELSNSETYKYLCFKYAHLGI